MGDGKRTKAGGGAGLGVCMYPEKVSGVVRNASGL